MAASSASDILTTLRTCIADRDDVGLVSIVNAPISPDIKMKALHALSTIGTSKAFDRMGKVIEAGRSALSEYCMRLLMEVPGNDSLQALARGLRATDDVWRPWILRDHWRSF